MSGLKEGKVYRVKLLVLKEVVEEEVKARYCLVDGNNNLVFQDKALSLGEPVTMVSARCWISVEKYE